MASDDDASADTRQLPIRNQHELESFDIVKTYHRLLAEDPELTMPVAAIEALIEALGASSANTVFETMDLVKTQSERLRASVRNPIALSHGTDLFQQYLLMTLQPPRSAGGSGGGPAAAGRRNSRDNDDNVMAHENFEVVRQHLMSNGRLFAERAKNAREKIAAVGRRYMYNNQTILTHGGSRVVGHLLGRAAESHPGDRARRFRVIHVMDESRRDESNKVVAALRARGVSVATIPESAVAYSMRRVDSVLVGAEAVTANGGIISRMGTYQLAVLAKAFKKEFYVAAEQHKIGKTFPLDQYTLGLGVKQDILDFHASRFNEEHDQTPNGDNRGEEGGEAGTQPVSDPVDYTPPEYIEGFYCDHGFKVPSAIAKEVIDMLF
ncbi:translation initiation factor-like protein eif-2b subunit alpha [Xylariomycetidae sp. FL0641]|nr:translation initiation factor-like protein eif-2b subunit alpha [Xylariomycetidae sp. FL0641]